MLKLRILEILEEQGHTKYWLWKQIENTSYQNLSHIWNNETSKISFDMLDQLSTALNVPVGDLFINVPDNKDDNKDSDTDSTSDS